MDWKPQRGSQMAFHECTAFEMLFGGAAGGAKRLRIDEPIPTPEGFKLNGELKKGDVIFSEKGKPITVFEAHPFCFVTDVYLLTFDDRTVIEADAGHLWHTFTANDLETLTRRTDNFRKNRRANRPSRATGKRGALVTEVLTARNKEHPPTSFPPPTGSVKTTEEIAQTLFVRNGQRVNHAILLTSALELPVNALLPIEPYLLGLWLGDGRADGGAIGMMESDLLELLPFIKLPVLSAKLDPRAKTPFLVIRFDGLTTLLRENGLQNNKHIPQSYLRSSKEQRLELLRGLMDSDGTANKSGSVSFSNTNEAIIDGVMELIVSLGWKARKTTYTAKLNGIEYGDCFSIKWTPDQYVFHLSRKKNRQRLSTRRTTKFRYIVNCEKAEPSLMRCITVDNPTGLYLAGKSMVVTHNSESLLVEATRFTDFPDYYAVLFRRSFPELQSSLVPRAYDIFSGAATPRNQGLKWTFKSGAVIEMSHLNREEDKEKHKSSEYDYIGFDELTSFSETSYNYLFSRCRGKNPNIERRIRAGSNPTGIGWSWVKTRFVTPDLDLVEPLEEIPFEFACGWNYRGRTYLSFDDLPEGFDGKGEPVFSDEIYTIYKEKKSGLTRAFIPALLWGNKYIIKNDPAYILRLKSLDEYQKLALLTGSWDFPEGQFFDFNINRHVAEPFDIPDFWERYVSIDYGYTAPMCALWFALSPEGKIYAYRELYARRLSTEEQAKYILDMTGSERINWFTCDPSMMGRQGTGESHADVYGRHGVYLSASSNKRVPGWALLHEYLSNGLFQILPSCPNLIREFGSAVRNRSNPEDLDCFVAGTEVETIKGLTKIEEISEGDLVLTPIGFQQVIKANISGFSHQVISVVLSNGKVLKGTSNHKVFVQKKGLVELQELIVGDILVDNTISLCPQKQSIIKALDTLVIQVETTIIRTGLYLQKDTPRFIDKFGLTIMVQFLKGCVSIIKTMMWIIMTFPILSFWIGKFMRLIILDTVPIFKKNLKHGEIAPRENTHCDRTHKKCLNEQRNEDLRAVIVEKLLKQNIKCKKDVRLAENKIKENTKQLVRFVQRYFLGQKVKEREKPVHIIAVGNSVESATVYNLTVDKAHLYYANGVLVTNTTGSDHAVDAARYFFLTLKGHRTLEQKEIAEGTPLWWNNLQQKLKNRKMALQNLL